MQTRKVVFGVGLMITGAIIFLTWYLCYTLMFCAESILPSLDKGRHGFDGQKWAHRASSPLTIR